MLTIGSSFKLRIRLRAQVAERSAQMAILSVKTRKCNTAEQSELLENGAEAGSSVSGAQHLLSW